jgi:hypothetical protein
MQNKKGTKAFVRLTVTLVALFAASDLYAQSLRVTAANSSADNAVYDILFNPAGTTLLNSDGSSMGSLRSLVFVPGSTSGVDLIVADTTGGKIVRYVGPTGSPTQSSVVVWSAATSGTPGPQKPDGLSVDSAGNLYVVTNTPNPAVWVLPPSISAAGGFGNPVLLDSKFAGHEVDSLVETVIVPATSITKGLTGFGISPGDLLVLVADADNDPNDRTEGITVFDYSASSIAAFLASPGTPIAKPAVALKQAQLPLSSKKSAVPVPTGMDIWPVDGSLLLSTNTGTILQYALPAQAPATPAWWTQSSATTFANVATSCTSMPCFGKLRAGAQTNTAYAFVTQPTGASSGNILEFAVSLPEAAAPSFTAPTLSVPVTTGSPEGLTVGPQSVVVASASTCATTSGCNPTGGLSNAITDGVTGGAARGVSGNVIQQSCIVTDTRLLANGSCPGTINISQACPGFPANFVPSTICGASGPNGNQFAIILSIANGVDDVPGILVQSQENPNNLLQGGGISSLCNQPGSQNQVMGWTPRLGSNEGTIPEGANVVDMSTFCDGHGSSTKGNSVWMIGGQLSTAVTSSTGSLVGFTNHKLDNLGDTIQSATIAQPAKDLLGLCLITSAVLLNTGHYSCAARNIYVCDQFVANNTKSFSSSASNSNPVGDVRARLGNLFYTINTRIAGNSANTAWPLTSPPPACH